MQRYCLQKSHFSTLLFAALSVSSTLHAAELSFSNFAPAAGEIALESGGSSLAIVSYGGSRSAISIAAGPHLFRAVARDGRELARGEITLRSTDAVTLVLAGNGSSDAPYEIRYSLDHNHPLRVDDYSVQTANLAVAAGTLPIALREICEGYSKPPQTLVYGAGTASLQELPTSSENLSRGQVREHCSIEMFVGEQPHMRRALPSEPGSRARVFAIGDGVSEPYSLVILQQGPLPEPALPLGPDVAGLWYPPGEKPGTSVVVAFDEKAPAGKAFSAMVSGFDAASKPTWRFIDGELRVSEYRGGDPSGTRPAMAHERGQLAEVVWHSCNDLTLVPIFSAEPELFGRSPRNAMRLRRLLPSACATTLSQEGAP